MLMILFPSLVMAMSDIPCPFQHSNSLPSRSQRQMLLSVKPANMPLLSGNHPHETKPTPIFSYMWMHSPELTPQRLITSSCPQVRIWLSSGLHETVNTGF
uniref:WD repeat-containing protein 26-like n=1 Tax=Rhizophora mucronata TaxID=61149 RepID=A0A2P2JZ61_RHIMU